MSAHSSLVTPAAVVITGFVLVAQILLGPGAAAADAGSWQTRVLPAPAIGKPTMPPRKLDASDEIAALERIQYALSEVGDGGTYIWRRWHGGLGGIVHPTASFRDASGKVCRHLVVLLSTVERTRKMEGIACRLPSGRWQLDG